MTFDVSAYELVDTGTLVLKNARGDDDLLGTDGKPVTAEVYSPGSPQGVKALHKAGQLAQKRTWKMLRDQPDPNDAVNAEREHADKLAAFTRGFSDNFPVSPIEVYTNPRLCYINRQIEEYIAKYGNFSKGSTGS